MLGNWFKGLKTVAEVKTQYRKLAMENHPDRKPAEMKDAATKIMQSINETYHKMLEMLHGKTETDKEGTEHTYYYNQQHEQEIIDKLAELLTLELPGCEILLIGKWLWVTGETKQHKELLGKNGAGLIFHSKRLAWYFKPYSGYATYAKNKSLEDLADTYGCQVHTKPAGNRGGSPAAAMIAA